MIYLQILITLFIIGILFKLMKQRQASRMSIWAFVVWSVLWLVVLVVFWQPDTTTYIANFLGIGRGADLAVYVSIVAIFYILFRIYVRLSKIESEITKIVRKDAIKNADKK